MSIDKQKINRNDLDVSSKFTNEHKCADWHVNSKINCKTACSEWMAFYPKLQTMTEFIAFDALLQCSVLCKAKNRTVLFTHSTLTLFAN